jgi:hypothetical protein
MVFAVFKFMTLRLALNLIRYFIPLLSLRINLTTMFGCFILCFPCHPGFFQQFLLFPAITGHLPVVLTRSEIKVTPIEPPFTNAPMFEGETADQSISTSIIPVKSGS